MGLRRFLGTANYSAMLVPALSDLCHPQREAIKNDERNWTEYSTVGVNARKKAVARTGMLKYLHPEKESSAI